MNIHQRILAVKSALHCGGPIKKDKKNTYSGYNYVSDSAMMQAINPLLIEHGLNIYPTVTCEKTWTEGENSWAKVTLSFMVVNADDPNDALTADSVGEAKDKKGDKAIYKANTGANKYFYFRFFGIASSDDPEVPHKDELRQPLKQEPPRQASEYKPERPHNMATPAEQTSYDAEKTAEMAVVLSLTKQLKLDMRRATDRDVFTEITGRSAIKGDSLEGLIQSKEALMDFLERCESGSLTEKELILIGKVEQ